MSLLARLDDSHQALPAWLGDRLVGMAAVGPNCLGLLKRDPVDIFDALQKLAKGLLRCAAVIQSDCARPGVGVIRHFLRDVCMCVGEPAPAGIQAGLPDLCRCPAFGLDQAGVNPLCDRRGGGAELGADPRCVKHHRFTMTQQAGGAAEQLVVSLRGVFGIVESLPVWLGRPSQWCQPVEFLAEAISGEQHSSQAISCEPGNGGFSSSWQTSDEDHPHGSGL